MATIVSTTYVAKGIALATWTGLANGEAGNSVTIARWSDKTYQVSGTFGAAGSVTLQGSNDGTNWSTMHNAQGSAITVTAAGMDVIAENPQYIRPNVTAGDGTTALTITICGVEAQ